jgi:hypothetical protein
MNNVLFRRGDQTFIDENVPLNDGQIICNETDEAIYVDTTINGSVVRKRYGGGNLSRSDIDMALSTISENPVANKVLTELMLQKADVIDDLGTALAVTENGVPTGCKTIQGLNTKTNNTQQMIAPIQTTLVASKTYTVGEQFIYNGLLYKATAAIAQAGTIIIDGNCALADSVTEQISNKIAYYNANCSGMELSLTDNGWYYNTKSFANALPANAIIISGYFYSNWTGGTSISNIVNASGNLQISIQCNTSVTLGVNRTVRVVYYIP